MDLFYIVVTLEGDPCFNPGYFPFVYVEFTFRDHCNLIVYMDQITISLVRSLMFVCYWPSFYHLRCGYATLIDIEEVVSKLRDRNQPFLAN